MVNFRIYILCYNSHLHSESAFPSLPGAGKLNKKSKDEVRLVYNSQMFDKFKLVIQRKLNILVFTITFENRFPFVASNYVKGSNLTSAHHIYQFIQMSYSLSVIFVLVFLFQELVHRIFQQTNPCDDFIHWVNKNMPEITKHVDGNFDNQNFLL